MIDNPLQMNDWEIKKFLRVVLVVQFAVLVLVGSGALGLDVPVLRQIVGFAYLSFVPGIIILRILKLHKLGPVKTLLYSVGLSLAFNMFVGFLVNLFYPHIGISRPISTLPLIITWTVVLGLMCFIAYRRDRGFSIPSHFNISEVLSPPVLFLLLLPLLAVVGTQLVTFYQSNIVLMILICLIGLVPILAMLTKFIPERLYSLAIYSIALSLLWYFTLVSRYLVQWDSFLEYHFFNLAATSGFWNWEIANPYNAMLSITVLPAIFFQLLDISGTAIFKVIYPLWFALVPLGLYEVYRSRFSTRQAFSAVFFFVGIYVFFLQIPAIERQMIAELFYVLLLMIIMDRETTGSMKGLFIVFGASLVVSHYSLAYLFIAFLGISVIMSYLLRERSFHVTAYSVGLFAAICLAWYMYISSSAPLSNIANLGKHIYATFNIEFLNLFSRDLSQIFMRSSPDALNLAYRLLWYLMLFFMAVGVITLVSKLRRRDTSKDYAMLAVGNYIMLGACIVIPFFSNMLGVSRMIHIASLILAPFCILGAEIVFRSFSRAIGFIRHSTFQPAKSMIAVTVALVLFFLFNSGLPFEIANSALGRTFPLAFGDINRRDTNMDRAHLVNLRSSSPTEQEVAGAEWLSNVRNGERYIWASYSELGVPALVSYGMIPPEQTYNLTPMTPVKEIRSAYIYLGYVNVVLGYGTTITVEGRPDPLLGYVWYWDISKIYPLLERSMKLYANGASEVYWSP